MTEEKKQEKQPEPLDKNESKSKDVPQKRTEPIKESREKMARRRMEAKKVEDIETWKPRTELGRKVKEGLITDIDEIFRGGERILESEMVDILLPNLETDLLLIGQARGKFGGGKRRIFQQTQKKTKEGNKPHFTTCALVGNKNGYIGLNFGKSKETVPARNKSLRKAKLNLIKIRRGCGSWECSCGEPHSIPFAIEGKCGSTKIKLMPAPKGKGLCIENECAKILKLAGIKDVWSKTNCMTRTKKNLIKASFDALSKLSAVKIQPAHYQKLGLAEGELKPEETQSKETDLEFMESIKAPETKESETEAPKKTQEENKK